MADEGVVVIGAAGQVGTAMRRVYPSATCTTRAELDLSATAEIGPALRSFHPSAVINCAAYTAVDAAESHKDEAFAVNATAVGVMAQECAVLDIPFITFSTDYVFDGRSSTEYVESDEPNPINVYGASKLAGEREALRRHPRTLVIRASWVISATHDNFVTAILRRAIAGGVRVVDDQRGKPTLATDLALATKAALDGGLEGIVHLANPGATTWYGLAREVMGLAGLDGDLVTPCASSEFPTVARRPASSILGSERADAPRLPEWSEGLGAIVRAQLDRIAS